MNIILSFSILFLVLITSYLGLLNIWVAAVTSALWLIIAWLLRLFPAEDIQSGLIVILPAISPFISSAISAFIRNSKSTKARDTAEETFAREQKAAELARNLQSARTIWITGLTLPVASLAASEAFYRTLLDAGTDSHCDEDGAGSVTLQSEYMSLRLVQNSTTGEADGEVGSLEFGSPNLSILWERLTSAGTLPLPSWDGNPTAAPHETGRLVLHDPDGRRITVTEHNSLRSKRLRRELSEQLAERAD